MKGSLNPKVKICCISSIIEAKMAIKAGASSIGLVGPMPSGPGIITNDLIREIASVIPSEISSFLLTSETSAEKIIKHYKQVHTSTIQMVDKLESGSYAEIKHAIPGIELVQVIHVLNEDSVQDAIIAAQNVDYLLLDSGNPNLKTKILGGTGQTHNWDISKRIREEIDIPLYLAGGLNSSNVREAIEYVQPYGVDLCSGVRTGGALDRVKLEAFFTALMSS